MLRTLKHRLFDVIYGRSWEYDLEEAKWYRWTGIEWEWREATPDEQSDMLNWWAIR